MPNILHRVGVTSATIGKVFEAFSTINGLSTWWTTEVKGEPKVGGILQFRFGPGGPDFEVLVQDKNTHVIEWKCLTGPEEWIDTHIQIQLIQADEEVTVLFRHSGWRSENEFMNHCSTQWAYFLIGLKDMLSGKAKTGPFGSIEYSPVSGWS